MEGETLSYYKRLGERGRSLMIGPGVLAVLVALSTGPLAHEPVAAQVAADSASDVVAFERRVERAVLTADVDFLDRVCSNDFTYTHGDGWTTGGSPLGVDTKSAWLASLPGRYSLREVETQHVEIHGDVAITTGQVRARTGPADATPREFSFWYVRVYEHRDGQWWYLSHRTVSGPVYEK